MKFNEDSRVKIPTILHCMRLGYDYVSLKSADSARDESTNIFSSVFLSSVQRINPGLSDNQAKQAIEEVSLALDNEDLGNAFYKKLINRSGVRLIDFENMIESFYNKIKHNIFETSKLEKLRDWLLPMLMNGQLTVSEARS